MLSLLDILLHFCEFFPLCLHFWPLQPAPQKHCLLYITIMDLTVMPYLVRMRFYATAKQALLCFMYGFIDSITMVTCVYSMILDAVDIPTNDSHCGEALSSCGLNAKCSIHALLFIGIYSS